MTYVGCNARILPPSIQSRALVSRHPGMADKQPALQIINLRIFTYIRGKNKHLPIRVDPRNSLFHSPKTTTHFVPLWLDSLFICLKTICYQYSNIALS
jgi:hypothetical protein